MEDQGAFGFDICSRDETGEQHIEETGIYIYKNILLENNRNEILILLSQLRPIDGQYKIHKHKQFTMISLNIFPLKFQDSKSNAIYAIAILLWHVGYMVYMLTHTMIDRNTPLIFK